VSASRLTLLVCNQANAAVVLPICAAILLVLAGAGVGLVPIGALVLAGFPAAWAALLFLLPLLIPLSIVGAIVAIAHGRRGSSGRQQVFFIGRLLRY